MGGRKPAEIRFISLIYSLKWLYRNRSEWLPWQATYGHGSIKPARWGLLHLRQRLFTETPWENVASRARSDRRSWDDYCWSCFCESARCLALDVTRRSRNSCARLAAPRCPVPIRKFPMNSPKPRFEAG